MIKKVKTKKDLKNFIYFVKELYKNNSHYIYPLFYVLYKELVKEVLKDSKYTAILSLDSKNSVNGRLLYTMEYNSRSKINICYWSYFDCIEDKVVSNDLFKYMEEDMKKNDVYISEGSFTPYDPDNRRGILINNYDTDPIIFTSYNMRYYPEFLEDYGYTKYIDTISTKPEVSDKNEKKLNKYVKFFEKRYKVDIEPIDFKQIDREIADVHTILSEADHGSIYQETPSADLIREVAKNMRLFLDKRIVVIARERETRRPIGFMFCLLDFNQVFKKLKGKLRPIRMLIYKKQITKARGMMQYVVPDYQGKGLNAYIYNNLFKSFKEMGIVDFEAGTVVEDNFKSVTAFSKFGGEINKTYRIYRKEITNK